MAGKEQIDFNLLKNQVVDLIQQRNALLAENKMLKQELFEAKKQNEYLDTRMAKLETDYKRLKLAKAYGWNEESKKEADNRISKLVRDINSCLVLLGE